MMMRPLLLCRPAVAGRSEAPNSGHDRGNDVVECARTNFNRHSAAKWRGLNRIPSNERGHDEMRGATVPARRRAQAAIRPDDALELPQRSRIVPRGSRRANWCRRYSDDAAWACSGNLEVERKHMQTDLRRPDWVHGLNDSRAVEASGQLLPWLLSWSGRKTVG